MDKKTRKLIDRFDAISEKGKRVTIFVYQDFTITDASGEDPQEIPGIKSLKSPAGIAVNKLDEERYEIMTNDGVFIVTRIR